MMRNKKEMRGKEPTETVCLQLRKEHRERYEAVRNWREKQDDPYFTQVDERWREVFIRGTRG